MSLLVRPGLEIPDADLEVAFIRSAGPGGQNVNKVASAVQLRFALERNRTLSPDVKSRLRQLAGRDSLREGERSGAPGCAVELSAPAQPIAADRFEAVPRHNEVCLSGGPHAAA